MTISRVYSSRLEYLLEQNLRDLKDRPPKPPRAHVEVQGQLLKVRVSFDSAFPNRSTTLPKRTELIRSTDPHGDPLRGGGGTRGDVTTFSRASRKRMLELMARLDWEVPAGQRSIATFVTLTYPKKFPTHRTAKRHLDTFLKRLYRRNAQSSAVWKMEEQKRGAPHFHLIIFNCGWWDKKQLQRAWGEIIGFDEPFTRIESIRSARGLMYYAAKYIGKVADPPQGDADGFNNDAYLTAGEIAPSSENASTGRWWGVFNRACLPFADMVSLTWDLARDAGRSRRLYHGLREISKTYYEIDPDELRGWTLFTPLAGQILGEVIRYTA